MTGLGARGEGAGFAKVPALGAGDGGRAGSSAFEAARDFRCNGWAFKVSRAATRDRLGMTGTGSARAGLAGSRLLTVASVPGVGESGGTTPGSAAGGTVVGCTRAGTAGEAT
ncbi:MAG TPA: hypothetical protein VJ801_16025, partial [Polyangia bacterium]|nr:hypothetical protein [Polyangia bacterium]